MKRIFILLLAAALCLTWLPACAQHPIETIPQTTAAPTLPPTNSQEPAEETVVATQPQSILPAAALEITEVMPDNRNLVLGHELDWIELYNPEDTAVNLDGYALTDDLEVPDALPLTGLEISAGNYLTLPLEDNGVFGLSETGETVYLTYGKEIVSQLTFDASQNGESFGADGVCQFPTPGYANTEEGFLSYCNSAVMPELVINEVMSANGSYYSVNYFYHYDLIEILNTTDREINLKDYYLTDKWDGSNRYYFPDAILAPGEYFVVLCSGDPSLGEKHAPFGLAPGDTVYLAKHGNYTDALSIPADLQYDESYGRSGNVPVYLAEPTPGKANTDGSISGIASPTADIAPGLYDNAVTVTLNSTGTIYYTTSGARPTTSSVVYTGPITIDDVTTLRAISVENGRKSPVANFTYVIGQQHELPVLVISLPDSAMWGETGLHTDVEASYEHEAVMTLFEDGEEKFTVPFGLCLHGNDSRFGAKKNYQLRFRAEYGVSKLNYHLFDSRDIDEFDSLLLKGGSEDWGTAMLRDELATSLADGTSALYTQAMKPVVVYLAGTYWGVHHLRERFSDEYVASHMNVSPESVDILFSSDGYAQTGSTDDFDALKTYVLLNDMSTPENYAYLCEQIDVNSLMDWYIFRTYLEDTDIANIRRCRSSEGDGKWHWMFFDLDWSFYSRDGKPVSGIMEEYGGDKRLMQAILASEAGRDAFFKRYAYQMRTVLNADFINTRIDEILEPILSEMPRDRDRWNRTMKTWERYVQQLRDFAVDREETVLNDIQKYFSLSDSEMAYYFGDLYQ